MNINKLTDKKSNIIIAVDGESASGKGTISKKLSKDYDLYYCQTSIFYRKLSKLSIDNNITKIDDLLSIASNLDMLDHINEEGLYEEKVTIRSSEIAAIPEVRKALNIPQKLIIKKYNRVIMEGRDIGTIIAPNADVKLYITANIEIRARRRHEQYIISGVKSDFMDVKKQLEIRDRRDKTREYAPLVPSSSAIIIDNSEFEMNEFFENVINKISKYLEGKN